MSTNNEPLPSTCAYHRSDDSTIEDIAISQSLPPQLIGRKVSNISMPDTQSGSFGAMTNMVNSVGAGIIGIPYAIANSGLVIGLALLILVAFFTDKSLRMIVELASYHPKLRHLGVLTFEDLARIPFGNVGGGMVLAGMFVLSYGAMVAYLLIIKDTLPSAMGFSGEAGFAESELIMIVASLVIILPLSMMRDMADLEKTSLFSVMCDIILVSFVVASSPVSSSVMNAGGIANVIKDNWVNSRLFIGLGVLTGAMACQQTAFIISNSLRKKTPKRWSRVTFRSIALSAILCLQMGYFGYLGFLDDTQGDILNNFDAESLPANVARVLLAVTMLFTYPMDSFVARHVLVAFFFNGDMDGNTVRLNGETMEGPKLFGLLNRRHQVTCALFLSCLIPALVLDDLGLVLSLTGALGASFISYICCGLVYLGINGEDFLKHCRRMLENCGHEIDSGATQSLAEAKLPKMGDDAVGSMPPSDVGCGDATAISSFTAMGIPDGWKPLWWYVGGFPIWTRIARYGALGTHNFIKDFTAEERHQDESIDSLIIRPCIRDYYVSIFLISFGTVAAVVGVASNIYVELNKIMNYGT